MTQCPTITRKGIPCPINGEIERNGFCHVHDPNGKYKLQHPYRRKRSRAKAKRERRKQSHSIALQIKGSEKAPNKKRDRICSRCSYNQISIKEWNEGIRICKPCRKGKMAPVQQIAFRWNDPFEEELDEVVYIFHLGFKGTYKVGVSRDWQSRLYSLRSGNPKIQPVLILRGNRTNEIAIHKAWARFRIERETFRFETKEEFKKEIEKLVEFAGKENVNFLFEKVEP